MSVESTPEPTTLDVVASAVESATDEAADGAVAIEPSAGDGDAPRSGAETLPSTADDLDRELEALGVKAPVEGQRENRLPYSRVKKIVENAIKKQTTAHEAALNTRAQREAAYQRELEVYRRTDAIIRSDPDRFLGMLAALNPQYKKFLASGNGEGTQRAQPAGRSTDPMPPPDGEYADGTKGYTPDGLAKLLDWRDRQTEARVASRIEQQYNERFGPIEQHYRTAQYTGQLRGKVRGQIENLKHAFGADLIDTHQNSIALAMKADPRLTMAEAAAMVLVPKISAERTTMREAILKELQGRPKAATAAKPVAVSAGESDEADTTTDVVRKAVAAAGLR